jgi:hypothetical protein
MRNAIRAAAAALLLVLPAAHAQNKCLDPDGKITYQREPCPRFESSGPQRPASAGDSTAEKCAADWEAYADGLKRNRLQAERRRSQGGSGELTRAEKKEQQSFEELSARFLPACGKFGFEAPSEPRAELRNNAVAKDLRRKTGSRLPK